MTREDQRQLWALKKALEKTCKAVGKRRGWKSVSGYHYRVRDNLLDVLVVTPSSLERNTLKINMYCKPPALDQIYWEVFHMAEEAAKQPFSFHVRGAFTARGLWLPAWKVALSDPEDLESAAETVFDQAEARAAEQVYPDLAAFRTRLEAEERKDVLGIILCLLGEGNYDRAMELIEANLAQGESGGFLRESGRRSVLEDARDWCAARMEEECP